MSTETRIEAGRELDALVAVEVMGWTAGRAVDIYWAQAPGESQARTLPAFSNSGACLEVLERMREQGWACRIVAGSNGGFVGVTFASDTRNGEGHSHDIAHAICRAALEAVRAEKEGE